MFRRRAFESRPAEGNAPACRAPRIRVAGRCALVLLVLREVARRRPKNKNSWRRAAARSHQSGEGRFRRTPSPFSLRGNPITAVRSAVRRMREKPAEWLRFGGAGLGLGFGGELGGIVMAQECFRVGRRDVVPVAVGAFEAFVFGDTGAGVGIARELQANRPG